MMDVPKKEKKRFSVSTSRFSSTSLNAFKSSVVKEVQSRTTVSRLTPEEMQRLLKKAQLFKSKATDSRELRNTFKFLSNIADVFNSLGGAKLVLSDAWMAENPLQFCTLQSLMTSWLLLMVFHKQAAEDKSWAWIVYEYMVSGKVKHHSIMDGQKAKKYASLLTNFQPFWEEDLALEAEELCSFFASHSEDPYSCLIGLTPTSSIASDLTTLGEEERNAIVHAKHRSSEYHRLYEDLLTNVIEWSMIENPFLVTNHVLRFVALHRGIGALRKGTVILVRLEDSDSEAFMLDDPTLSRQQRERIESARAEAAHRGQRKVIFARVAGDGLLGDTLVQVYLNPTESISRTVPLQCVYPLPADLRARLQELKDSEELENSVQLPESALFQSFNQFCNRLAVKHLQSRGVCMEIIDLANKKQQAIRHLEDMQKAVEVLRELASKVPAEVAAAVDTEWKKSLEAFLEANEGAAPWVTFQPTLEKRMVELRAFDPVGNIKKEFSAYLGTCEVAVESIAQQKEAILDGRKKMELGDWWLKHIGLRVNRFLTTVGYDLEAVPYNYTDTPPENTQVVRRNMILVKRILKSFNHGSDRHGLGAVIRELQSTVYPPIQKFLSDATTVLQEQLGTTEQDKRELLRLSNAPMENLSPERVSHVRNLALDVEYLDEMMKMDDPGYDSKNFHIVPISGLVVGSLCRKENECKTVLDLWEHAKRDTDPLTKLEEAILLSDWPRIQLLLSSGDWDINEQDSNGSAALHLCCSFSSTKKDRLRIGKCLLQLEECDIAIADARGNMPLHYLVRMRVRDGDEDEYTSLVRSMIEQRKDLLNAENKKKETPLHLASLAHNDVAVVTLLELGAKADSITQDGETALHYAARAGSVEVATVLLGKVDKSIENDIKQTALDVAVALSNLDVAVLLGGSAESGKPIVAPLPPPDASPDTTPHRPQHVRPPVPARKPTKPPAPSRENRSSSVSSQHSKGPPPKPPPQSRKPSSAPRINVEEPKASDAPAIPQLEVPASNRRRGVSVDGSMSPRELDKRRQEGAARAAKQESQGGTAAPTGDTSRESSSEGDGSVVVLSTDELRPIGKAKVRYDFEAENEDELSLKAGEMVTLLFHDSLEENWLLGAVDDRIGLFPSSYVVRMRMPSRRTLPPQRQAQGQGLNARKLLRGGASPSPSDRARGGGAERGRERGRGGGERGRGGRGVRMSAPPGSLAQRGTLRGRGGSVPRGLRRVPSEVMRGRGRGGAGIARTSSSPVVERPGNE